MKKILIANRGEIALRIMRTARKLGIKTVAVYSEADVEARHTRFADEAVLIGPAPSNQSYLDGDNIIKVAKELNVDGIHPGYGFLSENAAFAKAVKAAGMIFIGPSEHAINIMGSKLEAKAAVKAYDIPMVPGTDQAITNIEEAKNIAVGIGFPILIKASAGGGGKGMRIVESSKDFESQMDRAVSEAKSAFGDGAVFIEKYIASPKHIEIQVLADNHGNVIHLFERECSIQRRHQKVVEEAPSAVLSPELRKEMGEAAIKVAKSCNYSGAGTVEFLLDEQSNYYFLEMNTRLQVEHPVTEMITGIDLVEQQIKVARNEVLAYTQDQVQLKGHAVELRVYAEDPTKDFLPDIGTLETYKIPVGEGIRVDDAYEEGDEIPIYYDPMIAKLVAYAETRTEAITLLSEAIEAYEIEGIATTLEFGHFVANHEAFQSGKFDTHFVQKYFSTEKMSNPEEENAAAMIALKYYLDQKSKLKPIESCGKAWSKRNKH
ncbi:acetyl-CoA carboxylase biotin carboxylase subunit [Portibacter lacus]|uniref:Acetyl-CoA carboxylase biotin carboxylase subunit n=1 Tax=Portibacter lacus TaxID=1099794 RepID=A0AA37SMM4_9BACT|nr:acetyl-CoA carboxylase biotin carboxylase subunit [Portibacter lacus]GLR15804.1 acetyl-CoA carboxylase biotin carboxylase subunit [Portibacter lacus]